jgi:hypothetical protein
LGEWNLVGAWVKRIESSIDKEFEIKKVLKEIDDDIDSVEVKKRLLEQLYQELASSRRIIDGRLFLTEQADNKYYLDLIKTALDILKRS